MRIRFWLLPAWCCLAACNDLTEPLPSIAGTHAYEVTAPNGALARRGFVRIADSDTRTARFDGTFSYTTGDGRNVTGNLTGAFITRDSVWFRFLDERFVYHEARYERGRGSGQIFLQQFSYEPTGLTFSFDRIGVVPQKRQRQTPQQ